MYIFFFPKVSGIENLPKKGATIVYSNHISLFDPILIGCILPRRVYFMAKAELFQNTFFGFILNKLGAFPVKRGSADISAIKNSLRILKEGHVFGIFPEGTRNKEEELGTFSHGIASIAYRSKSKIVPIGIVGKYKLFRSTYINIGKPIDMSEFDLDRSNAKSLTVITDHMEQSLKKMLTKK